MVKDITKPSPFFWTDVDQASARLQGTIILYDRTPHYVQGIENHTDGTPRARLQSMESLKTGDGKTTRKKLDSPLFERFRTLPAVGFVNYVGKDNEVVAVFLRRRSRNTQRHGFNNENIRVATPPCWTKGIGGYHFREGEVTFTGTICKSPGYLLACSGEFPALLDVLQKLTPETCIAYSPTFAVYMDELGIRWLYRETERIGLFTGTDTLNLLPKTRYYREEIQEDPLFTCNYLREF